MTQEVATPPERENTVGTHDDHGPELNVPHPELPVADPGVEEHIPRLSDVDEAAANRAERQVVTMFGLVPVMAVLFNGLTTIAGFGSLMVAHHRGIFGLGLLLTIGACAALLASLVVLPVLIELFGRVQPVPAQQRRTTCEKLEEQLSLLRPRVSAPMARQKLQSHNSHVCAAPLCARGPNTGL